MAQVKRNNIPKITVVSAKQSVCSFDAFDAFDALKFISPIRTPEQNSIR
jgi:hypothetical protein